MQLGNYYHFLGNVYSCPFGRRKPDCPVYPLESDSFEERFEWFKNLSNEEKDLVVGHHRECSDRRGK